MLEIVINKTLADLKLCLMGARVLKLVVINYEYKMI